VLRHVPASGIACALPRGEVQLFLAERTLDMYGPSCAYGQGGPGMELSLALFLFSLSRSNACSQELGMAVDIDDCRRSWQFGCFPQKVGR
jgi:hypothetical protein